MNIKNNLIKWLGGFTKGEYNRELIDGNHFKLVPVYAESLNYYLDEDTLTFEKEQLAYKLGKEMLDNNLIDFSIKEGEDEFGLKIFSIRAKACVNEVKKKI